MSVSRQRVRLSAHVIVLAAIGCSSGSGAGGLDGPETAPTVGAQSGAAQSSVLPPVIATIEANPQGGDPSVRLAHVGSSRWALTGDRVKELALGRRYSLSLETTTEPKVGAFEVRRLVDLSPVQRLVGTLADGAQDAVMELRSVHSKSYTLHGDVVASYKEVRAALPRHDYAKTLFAVNAVADLGGGAGARWQWLDYAPVPRYQCVQRDSAGTHLDLVDVQPDASLLDGFITQPLGGREVKYGAHAECTHRASDAANAYACAFDAVGAAWGSATFVAGAAFEVDVERADEARTKVVFGCAGVVVGEGVAASED